MQLIRMPNGWLSVWHKGQCCMVFAGSTDGQVEHNVILHLYGFTEKEIAEAMCDAAHKAWNRKWARLSKQKRDWLNEIMGAKAEPSCAETRNVL